MDERSMFFGAGRTNFIRAEILRNNETKAEKILWQRLRKNQLMGFRFKRQHPIAGYIVDFYSHRAKLVVEVDEAYHKNPEQMTYDENRTAVLEEFHLQVLRFSDDQIFGNINEVLVNILQHLSKF